MYIIVSCIGEFYLNVICYFSTCQHLYFASKDGLE